MGIEWKADSAGGGYKLRCAPVAAVAGDVCAYKTQTLMSH